MIKKTLAALALSLLASLPVAADELELRSGHPESYTVVPGDTLWGIAGRFLDDPWRWSELWRGNPQIGNPDLIYPGDVIYLEYVEGRPQLRLKRNGKGGERPTVKLTPEGRIEPLDLAIPVIPAEQVRNFLSRSRVVPEEELEGAGYVLEMVGERLIAGGDDLIYARALPAGRRFTVVEPGQVYYDLESGVTLAREAVYKGDAELVREGDPATLRIRHAKQEILLGDRLLVAEEEAIERDFRPHPPATPVKASIISVMGGVSQVGQYQVVVLSHGANAGLEVGHVLEVMQAGRLVEDKRDEEREEPVQLPDERAGLLLLFRVFDRVSYALVTEATRAIHVGDVASTPR